MNINEIKSKQFETVKRGYNPEEVDVFLGEVVRFVDKLADEKTELLKKMEILANKVEEYKKDEESIQEALLGAQKLGKSVLNRAQEKADELNRESQEKYDHLISVAKEEADKLLTDAKSVAQDLLVKAKTESTRMVAEAQQQVETIIKTSKYEIEKERNNLIRVQKEVSSFKTSLLDLYRSHIDLIKNLPEIEEDEEKMQKAKALDADIYEQKRNEINEQRRLDQKENNPEKINIDIKKNTTPKPEIVTEVIEAPKEDNKEENEQQAGRELTEKEKNIVEKAKKDILTDTVEIAKEHYVKKFSELKFGEKSKR